MLVHLSILSDVPNLSVALSPSNFLTQLGTVVFNKRHSSRSKCICWGLFSVVHTLIHIWSSSATYNTFWLNRQWFWSFYGICWHIEYHCTYICWEYETHKFTAWTWCIIDRASSSGLNMVVWPTLKDSASWLWCSMRGFSSLSFNKCSLICTSQSKFLTKAH